MTHSGHEFDLTWFVRWTDAEIDGISFELVAPPTEGATIWSEQFGSLPMFRAASDVLPVPADLKNRASVTYPRDGRGTRHSFLITESVPVCP